MTVIKMTPNRQWSITPQCRRMARQLHSNRNARSTSGQVTLRRVSSGQPAAYLGSASGPASFDLITGGHDHYNWGFTAPGIYELTFTVSGILTGDTPPISDTAQFRFDVGAIPEPSATAALFGLVSLAAIALRRRPRANA
jgi:surface-anchored protein/MYXO-CTERM domain-containing protein